MKGIILAIIKRKLEVHHTFFFSLNIFSRMKRLSNLNQVSNITEPNLTNLTIVDNEGPDSVTINLQLPEGNIMLHDNDVELVKKLNQILCDPDIKSELGEQIIWNSN